MEGIATQKEGQQLGTQNMITNLTTHDNQSTEEAHTKDQNTQLKRQRREDNTGAGLAMQAGPRI
jgi:hypothetical protein